MDILQITELVAAGFGAGTVGAMLGVGGGMIIIPILTTAFEFQFEHARATSLFAVIATSSGVAVATGKERFGNLRLGVLLSLPTALVAFLNAWLAQGFKASVLYLLFSVILIIAGILMWRPDPDERALSDNFHNGGVAGPFDGSFHDPKFKKNINYRVRNVPAIMGVSCIAGGVSGLLGVGGGVFQVPAMAILGGLPMRAAAATSNFLLGITAAASLPFYMARGQVRPVETAAVVLGVLLGAFFGSWIAMKIHGNTLRRLFIIVLGALAYQMFRKGIQ
ncbi:MAG: sulfite exporter TauE/SafE family protein [Planctomycetes bacterium]|nr:sulfite exporter TauE/SafE family protein [Planctomycetota bacterium]